jgi:hypothetical protein
MRWVIRVIVILIVAVIVVSGFCLYRGVSDSIHAEHVLHGALLTVQLLDDYVVMHDGDWPKSWTDLERLPSRESAIFEWPKDSKKLQEYVEVDFSADPEHLAKQNVDEFDAVRPIGPYYPFKDRGSVEALIKSIRARKLTKVRVRESEAR